MEKHLFSLKHEKKYSNFNTIIPQPLQKETQLPQYLHSLDSTPPPIYDLKHSINSKKCQNYWNQQQQDCFIYFWVDQMINNPLNKFSFDLPLKRNNYFQKMSRFIESKLGQQYSKSGQICKSKYSTIKRKIKREKVQKEKKKEYGFIDYITERANKIIDPVGNLKQKLATLREMRFGQRQQYMKVTKLIYSLQNSPQTQQKNNDIIVYLRKHKPHAYSII